MADKAMAPGSSAPVKVSPAPSDATVLGVDWATGDPGVVSVAQDPSDPTLGTLTAGSTPGSTTVSATIHGVDGSSAADTKTVEVGVPVTGALISFP